MQTSGFRTQTHNHLTWIDIRDPTKEQVLQAMAGRALHPLHLDASLLTGHLPQLEKEDDYIFLLLHLPSLRNPGAKIATAQLAVFLAKDYLITIHREGIPSLRHVFEGCELDEGQANIYFQHSSGYLLYSILNTILGESSELTQSILLKLDVIEDAVFDDHVSVTYEIGQLRQRITKLKRLMDFFKTILGELAPHIEDYTGEKLGHHYRSLVRTAERLSVLLEESKETIEIFKDADYTASNEKTNVTLAVLTIIFTLTIPATVVASFYGMNIPLPGANDTGGWTFWGPYTTLYVVLLVSVVPALVMMWYFKRKKWF